MSPLSLRTALKPPSLDLDSALLSVHSHSSVCGSQAKSRAPRREKRHLRFDINMTAAIHNTIFTEVMMMFVFVP